MNRIFIYLSYIIRNIPGAIGQKLRALCYRGFFGKLGKNVRIDIGCIFDNPSNIHIGDNVWILPYTHMTAAPANHDFNKSERPIYYRSKKLERGIIEIGNEVSIGEFNIVQGYGGVLIEDRCTTSARVSLYSMSHAVRNKDLPREKSYANSMVKSKNIPCVMNSIILNEGVWVGHGSAVFGGEIGQYAFIKANSIILNDVESFVVTDGKNTGNRYE